MHNMDHGLKIDLLIKERGVYMKQIKKYLAFIAAITFMISLADVGNLNCKAAVSRDYFLSGNLYYHKVSGGQAEVCGTKKVKGKLTIPKTVTYKGRNYKVTGISDLECTHGEESIYGLCAGTEVFAYHEYHYEEKFPKGIHTIAGSGITEVVLPKTLTYIGEGAFDGCHQLKKVRFAKKYKKLVIGKNAFTNTAVKELVFPEGTSEIRECATGEAEDITIPASVKKIGSGVVNARTKNIKVSKKNKNFKVKSGILYTYNEKTLLGVSAKAGKKVQISSKTTKIEKEAFAYNEKIRQVHLGSKVNEIPKAAFAGCNHLTKIEGTDNIKKIGYVAFAECKKLADIGTLSNLQEIENGAFWGNINLVVPIPISSKMKIADYAFCGNCYGAGVRVTVQENDPVYSIVSGLLIKKEGTEQRVILQNTDTNTIEVPEGVTDIIVSLRTSGVNGTITFPNSLRSHSARLTIDDGFIIYKGKNAPEFCKEFLISNPLQYQNNNEIANDGMTTIIVPQGSLAEYKAKLEEAAHNFDQNHVDRWLDNGESLFGTETGLSIIEK